MVDNPTRNLPRTLTLHRATSTKRRMGEEAMERVAKRRRVVETNWPLVPWTTTTLCLPTTTTLVQTFSTFPTTLSSTLPSTLPPTLLPTLPSTLPPTLLP